MGKRHVWKGKVTTDVCDACYREFGLTTDDPDVFYASDSACPIEEEDYSCRSMLRLRCHSEVSDPDLQLPGPMGLHQLNILTLMDLSRQFEYSFAQTLRDGVKLFRKGDTVDRACAMHTAVRWETASFTLPLKDIEEERRICEKYEAQMKVFIDGPYNTAVEKLFIGPQDAGYSRTSKLQDALAALSSDSRRLLELARVGRCAIRPKQWDTQVSCLWSPRCMETSFAIDAAEQEVFMSIGCLAQKCPDQMFTGAVASASTLEYKLLYDGDITFDDLWTTALAQQKDLASITNTAYFKKVGGPNLLRYEHHHASDLVDNELVGVSTAYMSMEGMPSSKSQIIVTNTGGVITILIDGNELRLCELPDLEGCSNRSPRLSAYLSCAYEDGGLWKGACSGHNCALCDHNCKGNLLFMNQAIAMALCDCRLIQHENNKVFLYRGARRGCDFTARYETNWHLRNDFVILG